MPLRRARLASLALLVATTATASLARAQVPVQPAPGPVAPTATEEDSRKGQEKREAERTTDAQQKATTSTEERKAATTQPEAAQNKVRVDDTVEAAHAIFFSGDFGFTRSDVGLLVDETGFDKTGANGFLFGLAGGYRTHSWRFGLRWRIHDTTEHVLWNFSASIGYALKMRPLTPVFSLYLGYVFDQELQPGLFRSALPPGTVIPPNVDMKGLNVGLDINASYWVTKFLRVGPFVGADLLVLSRERAAVPESIFGNFPETRTNALYSDSGFGLGLNLNAGIRGAFDIGLE